MKKPLEQAVDLSNVLTIYLEALRADGVQIVILDDPDIYSEYAPYTYVPDIKEFIDKVNQMNRAA